MYLRKRIISIVLLLVLTALLFRAPFFSGSGGKEKMAGRSVFSEYGEIKPVKIYLATDTHYIDPSLCEGSDFFMDMVKKGDGKFMPYCEEINRAFIDKVIADKPDALIVAGDLTFNGARESHVAFARMLGEVEAAGIPVLAIPGNHDFTIKRAARFLKGSYELVDSIDASEYIKLYGDFGRMDSYDFDATSLSYVYKLAPNIRVLCVDVNTVQGMPGILTEGTLSFVKEQLEKAREDKAYVISVTHQTLLTHSELTSQGMSFINSEKLLDLYEEYGVVANFSGHMHIQHIAVSDGGVPDIATGSLMTSPNYYGEISLEGKHVSYRAVPFAVDDIPDFVSKSRQYLWDNAYRQGMDSLSEATGNKENASDQSGETTKADDDLAAFFADFNVAYIAGRSDQILWDDTIVKRWKKTGTFVPEYFKLVKKEGPRNFTTYDIDL
jgi:predicted MPP superfamily phosphohydrolase